MEEKKGEKHKLPFASAFAINGRKLVFLQINYPCLILLRKEMMVGNC